MNEQDNGQLRAPAQGQGGTAQPGPAGFGDTPRFTVDKKSAKRNEAVLGAFTIRDLTVFGSTLLLFVASLIPMFAFAYNLWNLGSLFFLGLGIVLPLIVTALFVARRLSPTTKIRIGSLSIDQFASVVASFTLAFFFLAAAGAFLPSMLIALLGAVGLFAATVLARWIPFFAGDFLDREEAPAHVAAREAAVPVRKPRAPKPPKVPKTAKASAGTGESKAAGAAAAAAGWAKRPFGGGAASAATTPAVPSAQTSAASAASSAPETQISGVVPAAGAATPVSSASSASPTTSATGPAAAATPAEETQSEATPSAEKTRAAGIPASASAAPAVAGAAAAGAAGAAAAAQKTPPAAEQTQAAGVPATSGAPSGGSAPTTVNPQVRPQEQARPQEPIGATVDPASRHEEDHVHPVHEAFWFAVAQPRTATDERTGAPAFVIEPGGWVLALEDRGSEFLVQHTDGRLGVLRDLSNIERG